MLRAHRTNVSTGDFGRSNKRSKTGLTTGKNGLSLPPLVQQVNVDGSSTAEVYFRGLIINFDIVYLITPKFISKEKALLNFLSPQLHSRLLDRKIGLHEAGSAAGKNVWTKGMSRLIDVNINSLHELVIKTHRVPKGCGVNVEAVAKYTFEQLDLHVLGEVSNGFLLSLFQVLYLIRFI